MRSISFASIAFFLNIKSVRQVINSLQSWAGTGMRLCFGQSTDILTCWHRLWFWVG